MTGYPDIIDDLDPDERALIMLKLKAGQRLPSRPELQREIGGANEPDLSRPTGAEDSQSVARGSVT